MENEKEIGKVPIPDGYYKLETCEITLYVKISKDNFVTLTEITEEDYYHHAP